MLDVGASLGNADRRNILQKRFGRCVADHQLFQFADAIARVGRKNDDDVDGLGALVGLSDGRARKRRLNGIERVLGHQAVVCECDGIEPDGNRRNHRTSWHPKIRHAGNGCHGLLDFSRRTLDRCELGTGDVDNDLRGFSSQAFADAIAEKGQRLASDFRKSAKRIANDALCVFLAFRMNGLQFDVKFAAIRAPGILAHFGPADLMSDGVDERQFEKRGRNAFADRDDVVDGGAGRRHRHLQHEMAFAELRNKLAIEEWNGADGGHRAACEE